MSDKQRKQELWNQFERLLPALVRAWSITSIEEAVENAYLEYFKSMENKDYERDN